MTQEQKLPYVTLKTEEPALRLIPLGDTHIGSRACDYGRLRRTVAYILENNIKVLLMGDQINNNLKTGKASPFDDHIPPGEQMELFTSMFQPLAQKGLIIALIGGNHDGRTKRDTDIDLGFLQAQSIGVPYLGSGGSVKIIQPRSAWIIYAVHGSKSGNPRVCLTHYAKFMPEADIVLAGHIHQHDWFPDQHFQWVNGTVVCNTRYHFTTGSMQMWAGYAKEANYIPSPTGCWELTLCQRDYEKKGRKRLDFSWRSL